MPVKKTAFLVGALAGGSVAVAAMAGAGMKLPLTVPHGGSLISASTAPIFAPPVGAPLRSTVVSSPMRTPRPVTVS